MVQSESIWERLIQSNLRLVVSIARRFAKERLTLDDLISDGQLALMNAVQKFDYSRGFRFSTYATHAIQKTYYRRIKTSRIAASRVTGLPNGMVEEIPERVDSDDNSSELYALLQQAEKWIAKELSEREQIIIQARVGFNRHQEPQTLRKIGEALGISKERVRQIQMHAIDKLRGRVSLLCAPNLGQARFRAVD